MAETLSVNQLLANEYEPKRKFQWYVSLDAVDAFTAKSTARPKRNQEEIVIDWMNVKRYLAGKGTWDEFVLELYDPIAPAQSQKVIDWLKQVQNEDLGKFGYAINYKRNFDLKMVDGEGNVIEQWRAIGAWPKAVDFGDLDYSSNEALTAKITLRADRWELVF
jgi:hypothetical protein